MSDDILNPDSHARLQLDLQVDQYTGGHKMSECSVIRRTASAFVLLVMLSAPQVLAQTAADCAAIADRAARDAGYPMGGIVRGSARGAAFGAIVGSARQRSQHNRTYEAVFDARMRGAYRDTHRYP